MCLVVVSDRSIFMHKHHLVYDSFQQYRVLVLWTDDCLLWWIVQRLFNCYNQLTGVFACWDWYGSIFFFIFTISYCGKHTRENNNWYTATRYTEVGKWGEWRRHPALPSKTQVSSVADQSSTGTLTHPSGPLQDHTHTMLSCPNIFNSDFSLCTLRKSERIPVTIPYTRTVYTPVCV